MARYSAIPPRWQTPFEKEWDRAFGLAMSAMRDPKTDESDLLWDSISDDASDLMEIICAATPDAPDCDLGMRLKVLRQKHAEYVATAEAERSCSTIPQERAA